MKIGFNCVETGLGNNGGTRTILRCAETLSDMSHDVFIVNNKKNKYDWHTISPKVKILKKHKNVQFDIEIATGVFSIESVLRGRSKNKVCYIRGIELWAMPIEKILKLYRKIKCFCNSEWQLDFLSRNGVDVELVYPGIDFQNYYDKIPHCEREYDIGGLYHHGKKTKRHDDIITISNISNLNLVLLNRDIKNISHENIAKFYNSIKVWVSASELEGLHNPPIEASLCGCSLVCPDFKRAGVSDYAIHEKTALIYPQGDLSLAAEHVRRLIYDKQLREFLNLNMKKILLEKIGTRVKNMNLMVAKIIDK